MGRPDRNESVEEDGRDVSNCKSDDDQKLLNLISQTAKKSSYNNSRRSGLFDGAGPEPAPAPAPPPPPSSKRGGGLCGCGAAAAAVDEAATTRPKIERGVLKDPASKVTYDVEHVVGEGGFSKVLLVRAKSGHLGSGVYAAKIIPKAHLKSAGASFIQATMLERNILGEFDHPFLLKLYHSFQERDRLVLVVDYCPGGSLHTHVNISLREEGAGFDEARASFYVAEIGLGIAHLHSHGIVHRDLKLENVLMHATGHVAVSDFGASKRLKPRDMRACRAGAQPIPENPPNATRISEGLAPVQTEPPAPLQTSTRSIVGTPAYMAPEMLLAQAYDFAVDWWALGVLLFTMLKGRLPFDAAEEDKMLWRIVKSKPRYDPARVPEWHRVVPTLRSMLQGGRRYYSVKRTAPANSDPAKIQPKRSPSLIGRRPQAWSQPTLDVLRALLQKRPATRLSTLRALGDAALYERMDWVKLEACQLPPPYVPSLNRDDDRKYVPRRLSDTADASTGPLDYKKGDSMKKLFRKFSHRSSFVSSDASSSRKSDDR